MAKELLEAEGNYHTVNSPSSSLFWRSRGFVLRMSGGCQFRPGRACDAWEDEGHGRARGGAIHKRRPQLGEIRCTPRVYEPVEEFGENCQGPNCAYEELYRRKLDLTIFTQLLLGLIASQVILDRFNFYGS